jgi:Fn3 domain-containing protein
MCVVPSSQGPPVISTSNGSYPSDMFVSMHSDTIDAIIFYTVANSTPPAPTHTGSTPTGSTLVYSGPISVDWQVYEEFKAIAYKAGMTDSNATSFVADNRGIQGPI